MTLTHLQIILLFIIFLLSNCINSPKKNLNCTSFKDGKFEYFADSQRIISERKGDYQIETTDLGYSKYKVTWTSECEYELELLETTIDFSKDYIGQIYKVKILNTAETHYSYECTVEGIDFIDKGTLRKIN